MFYPFSVKVNKCSGSCNNINGPYAKLCVRDVGKNINVKVFNLISFSNQTKHIEWHESCKCKCRLDASVCNNKQRWNEDKCRCECRRELSDKGRRDKGFIRSPSNCNCECDRPCNVGEYLDYENCKCRIKIVGELVEECSKNIDENEMIYNETVNVSLSDYKCGPCIISAVFIYFHWYLKESNDQLYLKKDTVCVKFKPSTQTTIY